MTKSSISSKMLYVLLGAIAVQCLTGSHPYSLFDNDTLQLKWQHLCRVKKNVAKVIERMIAPDYRQRYANATEALNAIESLISPPQQKVKPPAQPIQTPTPSAQPTRQKFQFQTAKLEIVTRKTGLFGWGKETTEAKITRMSGEAEYFREDLGNGVKLDMVYILAGSFDMGSTENSQEQPIHRVNLSSFFMGKYPITQQQYQAIMGTNPSEFQGDNHPVEQVSWLEAMEFCQKLSQLRGKQYILPSESQWEYACRAGTTSPFYYGETISTDLVNDFPPGDVGSFPANAWGLYDMHGLVWEWCLDEWADNYNGAPTDGRARENIDSPDKNKKMLLRGGSWEEDLLDCRSASRLYCAPDDRYYSFGFRVVCEIPRIL